MSGIVAARCALCKAEPDQSKYCSGCGGAGWIAVAADVDGKSIPCALCQTDGHPSKYCPGCGGSGWAARVSPWPNTYR